MGSSNKTNKTYFGLDVGKIAAKVLILTLEYPPFIACCAVPVLPPTSYPGTFANPAVPSFVDTIFLKIGFIFLEIPLFKILFLTWFFKSFYINVGLIS